jgi:hypothetical protein
LPDRRYLLRSFLAAAAFLSVGLFEIGTRAAALAEPLVIQGSSTFSAAILVPNGPRSNRCPGSR